MHRRPVVGGVIAVRRFAEVPLSGWNRPAHGSVDGQPTLKDAEASRYLRRRLQGADPRRLRDEIRRLRFAGSEVGVATYNAALKIAARHGSDRVGKRLWGDMRNAGVAGDVESYAVYIALLLRADQSQLAAGVFDEMLARNVGGDAEITAYTAWVAHTRHAGERRRVVDLAVARNPPRAALSVLLTAAVNHSADWDEAFAYLTLRREVLDDVDTAAMNTHTLTHLVALCGREGNIRAAGELFHTMVDGGLEPDTAAFTALLKSYSVVGDAAAGARILWEMQRREVPPNEHTYTTFLTCVAGDRALRGGLGAGVQVAIAEAVYTAAEAAGHGGIHLDTALMRVYAAARAAARAERHSSNILQRRGKVPDAVATYVSAACAGRHASAAPVVRPVAYAEALQLCEVHGSGVGAVDTDAAAAAGAAAA